MPMGVAYSDDARGKWEWHVLIIHKDVGVAYSDDAQGRGSGIQ